MTTTMTTWTDADERAWREAWGRVETCPIAERPDAVKAFNVLDRRHDAAHPWSPGTPTPPAPCGCSVMDGRCGRHGTMVEAIYEACWKRHDPRLFEAVWAHSDGYGIEGFIPDQGYDWSGIRDSSAVAIEAMFAVLPAGAQAFGRRS